jgi:hypothetical protein
MSEQFATWISSPSPMSCCSSLGALAPASKCWQRSHQLQMLLLHTRDAL